MKILTVSFFDDNFGDMLIRICFDRLVKTSMRNLGVPENDCVIDNMHIKEIDAEKIASADLILFSGGAMFGFNNLGSFDSIDAITAVAEEKNIPVVFSSLGINNMHADEESGARLNAILRRKCVRAMSVRESAAIFTPFAEGCDFEVVSVCDPAVWTKQVYHDEIEDVKKFKKRGVVGINVVRGGLFKANFKDWSLEDEEKYIRDLVALFDENGVDYRLFTNGSVLDTNSMIYIAQRLEIPQEKLICPDTTRELVRAVAGFDAVLAIRMHAGIISYALDIPSVNLVWNDKIPHFYRSIGYPDRALELQEYLPDTDAAAAQDEMPSLADHMYEKTRELLTDDDYRTSEDYLMSVYRFLYATLGKILSRSADAPYSYDDVCRQLQAQPSGVCDDVSDYRTKLRRGRYCYRKLTEREKEQQLRNIKMQRYLRKQYSSFAFRAYHFMTGILKLHEKIAYAQATMDDLDNVRDLFQAAVANLQIRKIRQWNENYPTDDDFVPDIKSGNMHLVYKGSRLAGVYTLTAISPDRYKKGAWKCPDNGARVLLRFAVHPDFEGFGFPKKVLEHIIQTLKSDGVQSLRTDIFPQNLRDRKLYHKAGFEKVGETLFNSKPFDLMELKM